MTTKVTAFTLKLLAAAAIACGAQAADDTLAYRGASKGTKVSIDGTSTIHDWTVEGVVIGGSFEVEKAFETDKSLKSVPSLTTKEKNPKATIMIPIRSLKSGKQKMDEIMQEAMKAKEHRLIRYVLKEMVLKGEVPASGTPVKFDTKGDLSMSGETKSIDMEVTMERMPDGKLKFRSEKELKMTDFKIPPPAPSILGMSPIKTGDEVIIKFEWLTGQRKSRS